MTNQSNISETSIFPILGPDKLSHNWGAINLEKPFIQMNAEELPVSYLYRILDELKKISGQDVFYGGYLEKRIYYSQSNHFKNEIENRNVHLGIDVWDEAGTIIYAPEDMEVHSFQYNDNYLDYGGTIITQVASGGYLLFGHLSLDSLHGIQVGQKISRSEGFARLGAENENGGWPPHLHLQYILNMEGYSGDYPGVVSEDKLDHFRANCPNPGRFLRL